MARDIRPIPENIGQIIEQIGEQDFELTLTTTEMLAIYHRIENGLNEIIADCISCGIRELIDERKLPMIRPDN